jgi:hypothetical protein
MAAHVHTRPWEQAVSLVDHTPEERIPPVLAREWRSLVQQVHERVQELGGEGQDQHGGVRAVQ